MARYAKYTDVLVAELDSVRNGRYGPVFSLKCQPPKEGKKVHPETRFDLQMSREASIDLAREIKEKHGERSPKGLRVRVEGFRSAGAMYRNANVDDGERFARGDAFPEGETFKVETVNGREIKRVYYANAHYAKGRSATIVPDQETMGIFDGSGTIPNVKPDAIPTDRTVSALDALLGDAKVEEPKVETPAATPAPRGGYAKLVADLVAAGVSQAVAETTAAQQLAAALTAK